MGTQPKQNCLLNIDISIYFVFDYVGGSLERFLRPSMKFLWASLPGQPRHSCLDFKNMERSSNSRKHTYSGPQTTTQSTGRTIRGTLETEDVVVPQISLSEINYSQNHPKRCLSFDPKIQFCHGCLATCRGKEVWVRHFVPQEDEQDVRAPESPK